MQKYNTIMNSKLNLDMHLPNLLYTTMIYIYDDGVHNNTHLQIILQSMYDFDIRFCTSSTISGNCLENTKLLIMPGGADLYFCEKLNGTENNIIKDFVKNGGAYLGICAGAYYACSSLNWNDNEINGTRELSFYKGTATGPIYKWLEVPTNPYDGSWIYAAKIKTDKTSFITKYNGGPVFSEPNDNKQVIARYTELENSPPAIVSGIYGAGKYILSSPHIEKFGQIITDGLYKHLNNSYKWEKSQIDKILKDTKQQQEFFKTIIDQLLQ